MTFVNIIDPDQAWRRALSGSKLFDTHMAWIPNKYNITQRAYYGNTVKN